MYLFLWILYNAKSVRYVYYCVHAQLLLKEYSTITAIYYTICKGLLSAKVPEWQNYPEFCALSAKKWMLQCVLRGPVSLNSDCDKSLERYIWNKAAEFTAIRRKNPDLSKFHIQIINLNQF